MHDPDDPLDQPPMLLVEVLDPSRYTANVAAVPYFLIALMIIGSSSYVWFKDPGTRVSRMHAAFSTIFVLWCLGRGMLRLAIDPVTVVMLSRMFYVLVSLATPLLFEFACLLTRREQKHELLIRCNWIIGITLAFLSVTTPWLIAGWQDLPWGMEPWHGPLGVPFLFWIMALFAVLLTDLWRARQQATAGSKEYQRLNWFAAAVVVLTLASADILLASGISIYPISAIPVMLFAVMTGYIHHRFGLVEVTTQLAADKMAALIQHALLILDSEGTIQVVNERTARLVGESPTALVGRRAREAFGEAFSRESIERLAQDDHADVEKEFILRPKGGNQARDLACSFISIRDQRQRVVAYLSLIRDVTDERRAQQQRLSEGLRDGLTKLPNRLMFLGLLDAAVKRARGKPDSGFAVCFLGLDRLRVVNEDLGFGAGDQILVAIAERLVRELAVSDSIARVGGDEFALLLTHDGNAEELDARLQRIQRVLNQPVTLDDHQIFPAASMGVATSDLLFNSGSDALRSASIAMFKVKEAGGGAIRSVSEEDMGGQRTRLESELRRAIQNREFVVFYQPVVSMTAGGIVGFEALVRWQHPQRGLVGPLEFVEYAEGSGLIAEIDRQVMEQACTDLVDFRKIPGYEDAVISVNMAEEELRRTDFVPTVLATIAGHGLPNNALRLELLERVALTGQVRETLKKLRSAGLDICVDDFGTGYSSLSRLHELPISVLKIDRAFVRAMARGEGGEKIISSILALASSLGMRCIAEGAGAFEEADRLVQLGCREIQGFYFSVPLPKAEAIDVLTNPQRIRDRIQALSPAKFPD